MTILYNGDALKPHEQEVRDEMIALLPVMEDFATHNTQPEIDCMRAMTQEYSDPTDWQWPLTLYPTPVPGTQDPMRIARCMGWNAFAYNWNSSHAPA